MNIIPVTQENLAQAAQIHAVSWQESHRAFCTPAFVAQHTPQRQAAYLQKEMASGGRLWMLEDDGPVGIVSVSAEDEIANLYVLPEKQCRGYGTALLKFAIGQCRGRARLYVLDNNDRARQLYVRHGFRETGHRNQLSDTLWEIEMIRK